MVQSNDQALANCLKGGRVDIQEKGADVHGFKFTWEYKLDSLLFTDQLKSANRITEAQHLLLKVQNVL